jgi:hypothetical protein
MPPPPRAYPPPPVIAAAALAILAISCGARASLDNAVPPIDSAAPCTPSCAGKWCGTPDGCGGTCSAAVLYGGSNPVTYPNPTDTWTWDGAAWTKIDDTGPVDPDAMVATGPSGCTLVMMADQQMWTRQEGGTWTLLPAAPTALPLPFFGSIAALGATLVLFGGVDETGSVKSDTWVWNGSWTRLPVVGPPARVFAPMARLGDRLVLFGGFTHAADLEDTWTWDGTGWTELEIPGPSARDHAAMAPLGEDLVLFGGGNHASVPLGDTWKFDGSAWTQLSVPGPSPRGATAMAPVAGELVLFGGWDLDEHPPITELADTWTFDGTAWTERAVAGPSARAYAAPLPHRDS